MRRQSAKSVRRAGQSHARASGAGRGVAEPHLVRAGVWVCACVGLALVYPSSSWNQHTRNKPTGSCQPTVTRSKAGVEVCPVTAKISHQTGYPRVGDTPNGTAPSLHLRPFFGNKETWMVVVEQARQGVKAPTFSLSSHLLGNHATGGLAREAWSTR